MSIATAKHQPAVTGAIMSANPWLPAVMPTPFPPTFGTPETRLLLGVPDFDLYLSGPIVDLSATRDYSQVTIKAFVDAGVSARATLENEAATGRDDPIKIKSVSLNFDVSTHRPRAHFFSDSFYAALVLAGKVDITIPEMRLDVSVHFDAPLSEISALLQRRQIYFALMVVEQTTERGFEIPEYIPGDEIDAISFTYRAVVERDFTWVCNDVTLMMPATEEMLNWVKNLPTTKPGGSTYKVMFGPEPKSKVIFGQSIDLGDETVFLEDAVIDNRDSILTELARNDGHTVPVKFRPLSRTGRYVLPNAPRLDKSGWDESFLGCINLEDSLTKRLTVRYHELAASTLTDLTPEQAMAVTARPSLGEDSYLISE